MEAEDFEAAAALSAALDAAAAAAQDAAEAARDADAAAVAATLSRSEAAGQQARLDLPAPLAAPDFAAFSGQEHWSLRLRTLLLSVVLFA